MNTSILSIAAASCLLLGCGGEVAPTVVIPPPPAEVVWTPLPGPEDLAIASSPVPPPSTAPAELVETGSIAQSAPAPPPAQKRATLPSEQTGTAGYISTKLHGNTTASGSRYSKWQRTASHPSLPFGTKVEVTNLSNDKTVVVQIVDRGTGSGRIIDLSYAAAMEIDLVKQGLAQVKIRLH